MTARILVTVSRSWTAWPVMRQALEQVHAQHPGAVLVHGDAPKGDRDAAGLWRAVVNKRSKGATQCAEAAEAAGITTVIYRQEET